MAEQRVDILADWRAGQEERRMEVSEFSDFWLRLLGSAILVVMLLFMMIGVAPYQHEAVVDPATGIAPVSPWFRFVWLGLFFLSIPIFWFQRRKLLDALRRVWPLVLLFIWFAATTRWALDPAVSSKRLTLTVLQVLICLGLTISIRRGSRILATMAVACAIMIAIDLGSWIIAPARSMTEIGLAAIHVHKNLLGLVMMYCCIVCAAYLQGLKSFISRAFWIAVILAGCALLIASQSKTSLGILAASALFAPALIWMLRQRASLIWAMVGVFGATAAIAFLGWLSWNAMRGDDPFSAVSKITFTQRTDVWRFSLGVWSQRPWQGVGFGSLWDIDPSIQPSLQTDEWFAQPDTFTNESHNGYVDLLTTTGIVGFLGGMALLGRWLYRGISLLRQALLSKTEIDRDVYSYCIYVAFFPILFSMHNLLESSIFSANSTFGILFILLGVDLDLRWPSRLYPGGLDVPRFNLSPGQVSLPSRSSITR